jgi:aryl-alcohol dehydrogenase-like predicted oxidoreductase
MEKRQLGKTDMRVTMLGFGGAELGFHYANLETTTKLLNEALDAGLNVIDTASAYLKSEELIGEAVGYRRKDYYLLTKCGATEGFTKFDWTISGILGHLEQSLRLLRTDYVDLLQLHTCSEEILRQGEAIEGLKRAQEKGYTRYIGYSGDNAAAKYALECGQFDTLQTSISIADQNGIDELLPLAQEKNIGVIVKRPIANAIWRAESRPDNDYVRPYWDRVQALDYDFIKGDLTTSISTALRFTLWLPGVTTAIVGTQKPGRWLENEQLLAAGPLPPADYDRIRARWREVADSSWETQS